MLTPDDNHLILSKALESIDCSNHNFTTELKESSAKISTLGDSVVGTTVANRYDVSSIIGTGGWSVVYKAYDTTLNRLTAIKAMHSHLCGDQSKLSRFQREAESSSKLVHPNIAVIYDCGELLPGRPYISMEFIDGISLSELLQRKGQLSTDESVAIFSQVCDGMSAIHDLGLIHRDLKPSNIKITSSGTVKILDFGLAKWLLQEQNALTKTDETLGTPTYMSPEQCTDGKLDARSDIYSLGCIMYEAITGVKPFAADNGFRCMQLHVQMMPPRFHSVRPEQQFSSAIEHVIFKSLAKAPQERFQTARELKLALSEAQSSRGMAKKIQSFIFWRLIELRKNRGAFTSVAIVLVLSFAGFALSSFYQHPQPIKSEQAHDASKLTAQSNCVLDFPDTLVGNIYLLFRNNNGNLERTKKYDDVSGPLSVPAKSLIELTDVPADKMSTLQILSKLKPNDLACLTLSNKEISKVGLQAIDRLKGLETLNVESTGIDDAAIAQLRLPNLKNLDLKGNAITDASLGAMGVSFPSLKCLSLRDTKVTDSGIAQLLKGAKITNLDLSETNISDQSLKELQAVPQLSNLKLTSARISSVGLMHLTQIPALRSVGLCETKIGDEALPALIQLRSLTFLNINHTNISAQGLLRLKKAKPGCEIVR